MYVVCTNTGHSILKYSIQKKKKRWGGGGVGGQDGGHNKINVSVMTPDCQTKFRQFDLKVKMTKLIYCVKNILFPLNRILNVDCQKKKEKKRKKKEKEKKWHWT